MLTCIHAPAAGRLLQRLFPLAVKVVVACVDLLKRAAGVNTKSVVSRVYESCVMSVYGLTGSCAVFCVAHNGGTRE
jgi:hypothetical protein